MKIKIINETQESTMLLRKITKAVALYKGISDNIEIRFVKPRSKTVCGQAYVGKIGQRIKPPVFPYVEFWRVITRIGLTADWKTEKLVRFLQVMFHEFDHTLGLSHREMMKSNKVDVSGILPEIKKIIGEADEKTNLPVLLARDEGLQEDEAEGQGYVSPYLQTMQGEPAEENMEGD